MRILCFGDCNTWGYIPGSPHLRYDNTIRWPKRLQMLMGPENEVIEEGLNSRTVCRRDTRPGKVGRNSQDYILPCLDSHDPLDWVVVMLGSSDLRRKYRQTGEAIATQLGKFLAIVASRSSQSSSHTPRIVSIGLPYIDETIPYALVRAVDSKAKIDHLAAYLEALAAKNGYKYIDGRQLEIGIDGIHLSVDGHDRLAQLVYDAITS